MKEFKEKFYYWFQGDQEASDWCFHIWNCIQVWDDLIDKNKDVSNHDIDNCFTMLLTNIPLNKFYEENKHYLLPIIISCVLQWKTANIFENSSNEDDINKAYVLRASYYELLMMVAYLIGGFEWASTVAPDIWRFYGEKFKDFNNEVRLCQTQ